MCHAIYTSYVTYLAFIFGTEFTGTEFTGTKFTGSEFTGHRFLYIVYVWWTISNSKVQFNSRNKLGNAVFEGNGYQDFLRCFADWLENWQSKKFPIAKNFTSSTQRKAL